MENSGVAVMNKIINTPVNLPQTVKVRFWDTKVVRSILARQYYVLLYATDGHNVILDVAVLRPWILEDAERRFSGPSTHLPPQQSGLYPTDKVDQCPSYSEDRRGETDYNNDDDEDDDY